MTRWHIDETRAHIECRFGRDQLNLARPCFDSLVARQAYARYHYRELKRIFKRYITHGLRGKPLMRAAWGEDQDRYRFEVFVTKVGAHAIACVHSVHALPDLIANAICLAFGLNLGKDGLALRAISTRTVLGRLRKSPEYSALATVLVRFTDNASFRHLAALSNMAKHQSIIKPSLNEDLTGKRKDQFEVRFSSFVHGEESYPEVTVAAVIEPAYHLASQAVVDIGNEINRLLASGTKDCSPSPGFG